MRTKLTKKYDQLRCGLITCVTAAFIATFIATFAAPHAAFAQFGHSDIDFGLDGNKIITNKRVYDSFFPTFGISRHFTSNPGYAAESDGLGTLRTRHDVVYNLLDSLLYWDGQRFLPPEPGVRIRIDNNPPGSHSTFVDAQSGLQLGSSDPPANRVGASSANGEVHAHVNFFLEPVEADVAFGAYGIKLAISTESEQIIDSDPLFVVFNYGLDAAAFEDGLQAFEAMLDSTQVIGDFNRSGTLDVGDIDTLTEAVFQGSTDLGFDINEDGQLNAGDRNHWIEVLRKTYFGDSNLDGEFSSADLVAVFQHGEYEDAVEGNSTWADGDWNGDRDFNSSDFVLAFQSGGYEQGPRAVAAVPEPRGAVMIHIALLISFTWFQNTCSATKRSRRIRRCMTRPRDYPHGRETTF